MNDFTPEQAKAWVQREFAKAKSPRAIENRIASERQMIAFAENGPAVQFPNSLWAHKELVRQLEDKLKGSR